MKPNRPKPDRPKPDRCDDALRLQSALVDAENCLHDMDYVLTGRPARIADILEPPSLRLEAALRKAALCGEALELRLEKAQRLNSSLSSSLSRHTHELVTRRLQLSHIGVENDVVVHAVASARYALTRAVRIAKQGLSTWDKQPETWTTNASLGGRGCLSCLILRETLESLSDDLEAESRGFKKKTEPEKESQ